MPAVTIKRDTGEDGSLADSADEVGDEQLQGRCRSGPRLRLRKAAEGEDGEAEK